MLRRDRPDQRAQPPRKATPKPAPPTTEPARNTPRSSRWPPRSRSRPYLRRARSNPPRRRPTAALRPNTSWEIAAAPASATRRARDDGRSSSIRGPPTAAARARRTARRSTTTTARPSAARRNGRGRPRRNARALEGQTEAAASSTGSGIQYAPTNATANRHEQHDVREHARRRPSWTSDDGDEHAEPEPGGAMRRRSSDRPAPDRGAGGGRASAALAALSAAPVASPWRPRATKSQATESATAEEHRRDHERPERDEQDRPPADLVGGAPGEQQCREHAERIGRVDERQRQRREMPQIRVGAESGDGVTDANSPRPITPAARAYAAPFGSVTAGLDVKIAGTESGGRASDPASACRRPRDPSGQLRWWDSTSRPP